MKKWMLLFAAGSLGLGALLAALSPAGAFVPAWLLYALLFALSGALLYWVWNWAGRGRVLLWMLAAGYAIRLLAGVGIFEGLKRWGYDNPQNNAGYVYFDAYRRDLQAWELASSDKPLWNAFTRAYTTDQYGGLLALSAAMYRTLSPDAHRTMLILLLAILCGSLGAPFVRRAAHLVFGDAVGNTAGWIFALYPAGVLLGASQMREPFLLLCAAMSFWGAAALTRRQHGAAAWLGAGLAGMLFFSPPTALAAALALAGWVWFDSRYQQLPWKVLLGLAAALAVGVVLLVTSWSRIGSLSAEGGGNILFEWAKAVLAWEKYTLEKSSGWVQLLFKDLNAGQQMVFLTVYGIAQPVLPATLIDPTLPIWRVILVSLAAGWYALVPLLLYGSAALWQGVRDVRQRAILILLAGVSWLWVIVSSVRGGGDQWDNPRYRTIFLVWMAIFAAWAWQQWRTTRSPWLWRIVAVEGVFVLVFLEWYISRTYQVLPRLPFWGMVGLIVVLGGIILAGSLLWDWLQKKKKPSS